MTNLKGGILHRGRRISIQARSARRRKGSKKWRKDAILAGHPPKAAYKHAESNKENLKYFLPGKAYNNSSKRPHSLQYNNFILYQRDNRMLVNGNGSW